MTLLPLHPGDDHLAESWGTMAFGAPTIIALARLCALALLRESPAAPDALPALSPEARTLLSAARERGVLELKVVNNAFVASQRFLAVYVERAPEELIAFRAADDPELSARFLEGFRQLCAAGLLLHHLNAEFSLSAAGFQAAREIPPAEVAPLLAQAQSNHPFPGQPE
ncbi:hypothetical protein [Lignipirellula cremea]|uniref:Uncharacterized protein n=1 Tax=Lignipirellula cremea TaxID=2528010 RepID=A0A518DRD2_9BACT|nr:hypothetical protein [Lignipirellula cremea]QDU94397.1 hypothetical protein Pla8534_21870 [Lignipirellula cremea]